MVLYFFFFFKQKTAYEIYQCDWSSDVCSSDLYLEWTPSRLNRWAKGIGPSCALFTEAIMQSRKHPEQGFRSVMGILRLSKSYPKERLETACARALKAGALSYKSVAMMLKNNLENMPIDIQPSLPAIKHDNIRGGDYFH